MNKKMYKVSLNKQTTKIQEICHRFVHLSNKIYLLICATIIQQNINNKLIQ